MNWGHHWLDHGKSSLGSHLVWFGFLLFRLLFVCRHVAGIVFPGAVLSHPSLLHGNSHSFVFLCRLPLATWLATMEANQSTALLLANPSLVKTFTSTKNGLKPQCPHRETQGLPTELIQVFPSHYLLSSSLFPQAPWHPDISSSNS